MQNSVRTEIIGITPEELKENIINDVKQELSKLVANLSLNEKTQEEYLTRKEVAKILKVSVVTLSDWEKKKILSPNRLGNLIRYKKSDIDNALIQINEE